MERQPAIHAFEFSGTSTFSDMQAKTDRCWKPTVESGVTASGYQPPPEDDGCAAPSPSSSKPVFVPRQYRKDSDTEEDLPPLTPLENSHEPEIWATGGKRPPSPPVDAGPAPKRNPGEIREHVDPAHRELSFVPRVASHSSCIFEADGRLLVPDLND